MSVIASRLDDEVLRGLVEQFRRTQRLEAAPIPAQRLVLDAFVAAVAEHED